MNKLSNLVFDVIKERRTIRKYKIAFPNREAIKRISDVPFLILQDFPIPFTLLIVESDAKSRTVQIVSQTYSVARDLAVLYNVIPDELKDWWKNFMKDFVKTLGGAPLAFIGLTKAENFDYNFRICWMIAQAIMIQAKAEGLDTGSITFASQTVEEEFFRDFLKMSSKEWKIAFVLNCGYRDEEPIAKEVRAGIYEIY